MVHLYEAPLTEEILKIIQEIPEEENQIKLVEHLFSTASDDESYQRNLKWIKIAWRCPHIFTIDSVIIDNKEEDLYNYNPFEAKIANIAQILSHALLCEYDGGNGYLVIGILCEKYKITVQELLAKTNDEIYTLISRVSDGSYGMIVNSILENFTPQELKDILEEVEDSYTGEDEDEYEDGEFPEVDWWLTFASTVAHWAFEQWLDEKRQYNILKEE